MLELYFVYNGHRKCSLGKFVHIHAAVKALKAHQAVYSAINNPRFCKSISGECIRIDYGAKDCYYVIERTENDRM